MYENKTLRKMRPNQRRAAEVANELEKALQKQKRLVEALGDVEWMADSERKRAEDPDRWSVARWGEAEAEAEGLFTEWDAIEPVSDPETVHSQNYKYDVEVGPTLGRTLRC